MNYLMPGLAIFGGLALASPAGAQDPVKTNPKVYRVMFENAAVRVLHVGVAPGGQTTMHEHPDNAVVLLTDAKMRFTGPDGTTSSVTGLPSPGAAPPNNLPSNCNNSPSVGAKNGQVAELLTCATVPKGDPRCPWFTTPAKP